MIRRARVDVIGRARVDVIDPLELDPVDPDAVHDDAESTDHLVRLDDVRDRIEGIVGMIPDERNRTVAWDLVLALIADVGRNR